MKKVSKFSIILALLLIISFGFNLMGAFAEGTPEPGSEQDPLITKSYVDKITGQFLAEIAKLNEQITALKAQTEAAEAKAEAASVKAEELKVQLQSVSAGTAEYVTVGLEPGQQLLPGSGTELILISGKALAVPGKTGSLLDATSAKVVVKNSSVLLNHLLISLKDDGRALKATVKSIVYVKGLYKTSEKPVADNKPTEPAGNKIVKGKVNVTTLNLRSEPSTNGQILAKLSKGAVVEIISTKGEWMNIKTSNGLVGWSIAKSILKQ